MARLQFLPAVLAVLFSTAAAQNTPIYPMFVLGEGNIPASLDASLVAVKPDPTETDHVVMTFSIDCPTATNADNDACRAQSIYPAEVWHTQGSVWGGTITSRAGGGSTTMWECDLGSGMSGSSTIGPQCTETLTKEGGGKKVVTMQLSSCYVAAHNVPLIVTAGAEKLSSYYYQTGGLEEVQSILAKNLASLSCPARTTAAPGGAPSTTANAGGAETTAAPAPTTGSTATQSEPSNTSAASPSSTSNSALSGAFREMPLLVAGGAVVMYFVV